MNPLPCIVCGVQPEAAAPGKSDLPYKATVFTSYGHYGSTVIDTMGEYFIEVNICDDCLRKSKDKIRQGSHERTTTTHYEPWEP